MGAFTVIRLNDVEPCFFAQFELVGFSGSAGTDESLPLRSTGNIFNKRTIAIGSRSLYKVLRVAVGTLNEKTCCRHERPHKRIHYQTIPLCQYEAMSEVCAGQRVFSATLNSPGRRPRAFFLLHPMNCGLGFQMRRLRIPYPYNFESSFTLLIFHHHQIS
jgi:hypothetical protein